jgi:hypothetical protein
VPVAAEQQVAELAEEEEEEAPDSDDVPFLDLVEFVVKKICNPGNKFSKKKKNSISSDFVKISSL